MNILVLCLLLQLILLCFIGYSFFSYNDKSEKLIQSIINSLKEQDRRLTAMQEQVNEALRNGGENDQQ